MHLKIEYLDKKALKPYANNAKIHTVEQVEQIKKSIREFGFNDPIAIWHDDEIIEGHGRLLAVMEMDDIDTVPIIRLDDLTDEQRRAYMLVHNKLTMNTDFDFELLDSELDEIIDIDMSEFGFDVSMDEEQPKEIIEDEVPEEVETRCELGDIWQLGVHRLICGDSTDSNVIDKLMDGAKAKMTFSDPPYNVNFQGSMSNTTKNGIMIKHKGANQRHEAIKNDKMSKEAYYDFICKFIEIIKNNVVGAWYISFSSVNIEELLNPLRDNKMDWKSIIIWMKNQATLSMKDYKSRYEPIVYGRFDGDFFGEKAKEEDVWEYQRTLKNDLHPTMKPIPLICNMLKMSSKENDGVLDCFGGSGSTLIACEQLNRQCYMCELDEHYCDVIIQRWENFTGKKAKKL